MNLQAIHSTASPLNAKKVYVQTWGCQMNVADSERMMSLLEQKNYKTTSTPESADLIILNTCHIREKARHKVVSRLGELRELKKENPKLKIAVAGCVAQAEAKKLSKDAPYIDLIFGPDQIETLPALLEKSDLHSAGFSDLKKMTSPLSPFVETKFDTTDVPYSIPIDTIAPYQNAEKQEITRFVNIIKGCNNFCTFCVVPYTRGREKSRSQAEILEEVNFHTNHDVKEIVLLGQNVNSYGLDLIGETDVKSLKVELPFAELLKIVAKQPGVERLRFTTSNPHDFTPALAQAFAEVPQITNSFHLAVQSGSDRMLDRMNRQYTRAEYLERVGWIRAVRPEVAFSTDIIVGFPGETEEDFAETLSLIKEMKFAFIYAFKYSIRKGTPAVRFKDQVPEDVKDKRLQILLALQHKETLRQNKEEVGKVRDVMVVYRNSRAENSWYGRTYEGRLVKFSSPRNLLGKTLKIKIIDGNITALEGILV